MLNSCGSRQNVRGKGVARRAQIGCLWRGRGGGDPCGGGPRRSPGHGEQRPLQAGKG